MSAFRSVLRPSLLRSVSSSVRRTSPSIVLSQLRFLSNDLRSQIEKAVKENDVLVFMKGNKEAPQCGFSRAVVQILGLQGVENFKTVNVLADEEVRSGIKEYSSWPTVPQVYIKGEFIGGCDIMMNMHQSGELDQLLKEKGIVKEDPAATTEQAKKEHQA
ncbi:monothiol glutaredoxin grx5 [Gaertneriomyces sp. JEL0708]|nr:monothiol glutaredoxin grx5 [Gaertneriomyces sp. JEL0708]